MNKYTVYFSKEKEIQEPCYSATKRGKVKITGWINTMVTIFFKKVHCGITNVEEFKKIQARKHPELTIINIVPYEEPSKC